MKLLKQALAVFGAVAILAVMMALVAPKRIHAMAAALVEVTNTSANPVPNRDVDDRDRATIEFVSCFIESTPGFNGLISCSPSFTVPGDARFVIDQIDGTCGTPPGKAVAGAAFEFTTGGSFSFASIVLTPQSTDVFGEANYSFNQSVHYVADPGSTLVGRADITDRTGATFCTFDFSGHLVSFP